MGDHRWPDGRVPVLLSAHDPELIRADAAALAHYLDEKPELTALAAQLARTRRIRRYRTVIRAADTHELTEGLRAVAEGRDHPLVTSSDRGASARTAFVFPGQGGQQPGMGADAYRLVPVYRAQADACAAAFSAAGYPAPTRYLTEAADPQVFTEIEVQGAQFTHAVALAEVWRSCGVTPDLTVGHSLGEVAAAYLAETICLADAVAVLAARAGVVERLSGDYAVAALGITEHAARDLIAQTPGWLELSVINSSASVAVSGDRSAVRAAVETAQARGHLGREITVNFPVHTSVLDPLREGVEERLPDGRFAERPVQFIGSVTGDVVAAGTEFRQYWYANLRRTVRFDRAVDAALRCGATTFVEMSNHPALLHSIQDRIEQAGLSDGAAVLAGCGLRGEPLGRQLAANIGAVAVADPGYRWRERSAGGPALRPVVTLRKVPTLRNVPPAPMRATHLWAHREPLAPRPQLTVAAETWLPTRHPVVRSVRKVAVVGGAVVGGGVIGGGVVGDAAAQPLAARVAAAVDAHDHAVTVAPADADLLIAVAPRLTGPDSLAAAVGAGLFDHLGTLGQTCRDVWLVTVGAECTGPADPPPQAEHAALAAMHRSLAYEHPDQTFHHLDLTAGELDGTAVEVLLGGSGELALRDQLYRRELHDTAAQVPPAWPLSEVLDNVVIT
ncbi:MAG: mbtD, partial [Mycobacterium sp.]|nr:mbtD [Mycobacterium sp.]